MRTLGKLALVVVGLTAVALPASAAPPPNLVVHCWVYGETVVGPYGVSNVWYLVTDKNTQKQRYVSDANVDVDQSLYPNC